RRLLYTLFPYTTLFRSVVKKDSNFPGVHFGLGEVYHRTSDTVLSEVELKEALREDPNHPAANYYLADILLKEQKPSEALPLFQRAVAGDPKMVRSEEHTSELQSRFDLVC